MIWIWWRSVVIKAVKGQFQYLTLDVHYLTLRAKISLYNRKAARRHGQNFVFEFRFTLCRFTFILLDFMGCLIDKLFINLILHIVLHFQHLRCFRGCRIWHLNFHQKPARLHGADKSRLGDGSATKAPAPKYCFIILLLINITSNIRKWFLLLIDVFIAL